MSSSEYKFQIDQKVVYPSQGVGKITDITEKKFKDQMLTYYVIYLAVSDMVVMVPVDRVEELGIRAIVSAEEAQKAIRILGAKFEKIVKYAVPGTEATHSAVLIRKVSRLEFIRLIGGYSKGKHAELPPHLIQVFPAEEIRITAKEDIVTCLDGECSRSRSVVMRLSDKRVNFFGPAGCSPNATAL